MSARQIDIIALMFVHAGHDLRLLPLLGLFCIGYGVFVAYRGASAGKMVAIDVAELESGKIVNAAWLNVRGVPRWDLSLVGDGENPRRIVPVVSEQWAAGKPVAIFLEMFAKDGRLSSTTQPLELQGTVVVGRSMGSEFPKRFLNLGIKECDHAMLIAPGRTPHDNIVEGGYWSAAGVGMVLIYLAIPRRWRGGLFDLNPHRRL